MFQNQKCDSVSEWLSEWQCHLLSCSATGWTDKERIRLKSKSFRTIFNFLNTFRLLGLKKTFKLTAQSSKLKAYHYWHHSTANNSTLMMTKTTMKLMKGDPLIEFGWLELVMSCNQASITLSLSLLWWWAIIIDYKTLQTLHFLLSFMILTRKLGNLRLFFDEAKKVIYTATRSRECLFRH